jgi:hypothetical protein
VAGRSGKEQAARVFWRVEHSCALHIRLVGQKPLHTFLGGSRVGKNALNVSWLTWVFRVSGPHDFGREVLILKLDLIKISLEPASGLELAPSLRPSHLFLSL